MVLSKQLNSFSDIEKWQKSHAYLRIIDFIEAVNKAVAYKPIPSSPTCSDHVLMLANFLDELDSSIEKTPLDEQPQRFGNKAFRVWFENIENTCVRYLRELVFKEFPINDEDISDLAEYFMESVGNKVRIDYGTGHELAFIAFLSNLFSLNFFLSEPSQDRAKLSDVAACGLVIMPNYLNFVRHLQMYFKMEPAGSHGVWSLDDFQFIPFIWGSSQLMENLSITPEMIPDSSVANAEKDKYLFFSCIDYIFKVKTGPFFEHSSTLYGLTNVNGGWNKINQGMIKMYKAEVLGKFPVVQHFKFGKYLKQEPCARLPDSLNATKRLPSSSFRVPMVPDTKDKD